MLFEVVVREVRIAQAVAFGFAIPGEEGGAEYPVPQGELGAEVLVVGVVVGGVVPAVHFRSVQDVLQRSGANVDVAVNVHPPNCVDCRLDGDCRRMETEQE